MFETVPPELRDAAPGVAGSAVALLFMRRPWLILLGMFFGGGALAYFATPAVSEWLSAQKHSGLIGFLLGTFGMALLAKLHDTLNAVSGQDVWAYLQGLLPRRKGD